jgi:hypothetical protein
MRLGVSILLMLLSGCALFSTGLRDCASLCRDGKVDAYKAIDEECRCKEQ